MIIKVLGEQYRIGSKKDNVGVEKPNLLKDLNSVIEWDFCRFPIKLKDDGDWQKAEDYIEDREFLGKKPELKPGNTFYWQGQVFAIESDRELKLIISETGGLAPQRFYENLKIELELLKDHEVDEVIVEKVENCPDNLEVYRPQYEEMKMWANKYMLGRFEREDIIKVTVKSEEKYIFGQQEFLVSGWKILYNKDEIEPDEIPDTVTSGLGWLYKNVERLPIPIPEKEENTKEEGN